MVDDRFKNALILTGPTGSGKSQLALRLAEALGAEIIAMDSMTVYRGMDIGTAKPGPEERNRVRHHLLDILEPSESASVAWWLDQAADCCQEIESRGKKALIVGGTPLYLKTVLHGLFKGPPGDELVRQRLEQEAASQGPEFLHDRLKEVDAVSGARLHANDIRRVIRALEVWELTGQPISAWQQEWVTPPPMENPGRCLCIDLPREELYRRINARVVEMMERGLVEEVRRLRNCPGGLGREASQAVGYKELFTYIDEEGSLEKAVELIQTRSRQLAKRQMTWFRSLKECQMMTADAIFSNWVG